MKFGIFYEMFVSPHELDAEARIIRQTVDQIVQADKSGFDHVWISGRPRIRPKTSGSASDWR